MALRAAAPRIKVQAAERVQRQEALLASIPTYLKGLALSAGQAV
jgi:hypothetical protein